MPDLEQRIELLKAEHRNRFGNGSGKLRAVFAPYRICPLGAHVDHQLGRVTGMTINSEIALVFNANPDGKVRLRSNNFPDEKTFSVRKTIESAGDWSDYARGAVVALKSEFPVINGINATLEGNMPIGGLSSSAAVGVAYLLALEAANGIMVSRERNIEFDGAIENNFIHLANGVLDQSVILLSEKGRLLLLDCESGKYERIPMNPAAQKFEILIAYSGVAKKLVDTDYNRRVLECEAAATALLEYAGKKYPPGGKTPKLRHVGVETYNEHGGRLDKKLRKRAEHFFSENRRVEEGTAAWKDGNLELFGALIKESCDSSICNYECGCEPMIDLADIMNSTPGVYGARFSGAGFRGCCVGISAPEARVSIKERIEREYAIRQPEYAPALEVHFRETGTGAGLL